MPRRKIEEDRHAQRQVARAQAREAAGSRAGSMRFIRMGTSRRRGRWRGRKIRQNIAAAAHRGALGSRKPYRTDDTFGYHPPSHALAAPAAGSPV